MAVVFWKIRVITKLGCVSLWIQPENRNCSCPLPGLKGVRAWVSCWPEGIGGLVLEGSSLRVLCGAPQVWCVCRAVLCRSVVPLWAVGAQSGSLEFTALVLAELSRMDSSRFASRGLRQNFRSPFPVDLSAHEFRQGGHKTVMCLLKLCMEDLSVKMVQHHCSHGMITILLILSICCLLIFVHELRAIQRNYTHIVVPSGRTISKMKPLKAC